MPVPKPDHFIAYLAELQALIEDFKTAKTSAEAARPDETEEMNRSVTDHVASRDLPPRA